MFHPKCGFGVVQSLTRCDPLHPLRRPAVGDSKSDSLEPYYDIRLLEGGTLLVPVEKAERVGLRRLTNGLAAIKAGLHSPARSLPANHRTRAAILREQQRLSGPDAIVHTVRDMLAQSRGRSLSASEQDFLDKSCQRLSVEVSLVDNISLIEARAAVWEIIVELGGRPRTA